MKEFNRKMTLPIVVAVFVALMVVAIGMQSRTKSTQASAAIVSQPMIGGTESKREGPWPDCVGLEGPTCVRIIETYAEDLRGHVFIIEPDTMVTADFDTDRVRVWVNASSIVIKIPKRG